jgi:ABC-type multidrug transport system fused ATPase/permease subunit
MFIRIKTLYKLLSYEQRKRLLRLQVLVVFMAFAEVAGVAAIGPFMALVGDMDQLQGEGMLAQFYLDTGFESPQQFLFWLGIFVLIILTGAAAISISTVWKMSMFGSQIGADLSTRLYTHYMKQPWLFHAGGSSSELTSLISQESNRVTKQIIQPLMQMNAKGVMAFVMATAIFIFNPWVALTGLTIFGVVYYLLFRTVRFRLAKNGKTITKTSRQRFKLMSEGFGGIKDTLLLGRQAEFNSRFEQASRNLGHAQGFTIALSQAPRYLMELIAFASVIFLVLYLLEVYQGNLGHMLPILSVYALAGFKLLPAFQLIYANLSQIKANLAAFDSLEQDLINSQDATIESPAHNAGKLSPQNVIELDNVLLTYPGKQEKALNGLSLTIPVNQVIGLVGASGSGKSTAIDVLLGLIHPQKGGLKVDGTMLKGVQLRAWQNNVGFVPQAIFLADASIRENIAFGISLNKISSERVTKAAKMAHLDELLERLPDGLDTRVGERGIQLSGGQRQRIGIARALYDDAEVLILDEATSALDGITEKLVMDAIHDFSGKKTIIMIAHRLATVKQCDCIYLLEAGKVVDEGTYEALAKNNSTFQEMVEHA